MDALLDRVCVMLDDVDIVPLTDTLGTGVFELVCVVVSVNDCDELFDRVVEPLADDEGSVVLLVDSDADELAVCVTEPDTVAAMLVDGDAVGDADIDCTGPV